MNPRFLTAIGLLALLQVFALNQTQAALVYGDALGVSLDNVVVPGAIATIPAILRNTGNTPVVFPASIRVYRASGKRGASALFHADQSDW